MLDRRTPTDLAAWSRVWVEEAGRPSIATELTVKDGRIAKLAFRQRDPRGRPLAWPQQLRVVFGHADGARPLSVALDGGEREAPEAIGQAAPLYVLPNGEGWAYGYFAVDPHTLTYLSRSLPEIADPLTRGSAWVTLWDAMLEHSVAPTTLADLAVAALPRETDEQLTARVLGYLRNIWWRYLTSEERSQRVARVEPLLRSGLDRAKTASQKAAWFNALRDIATSADSLTWLRRVWEHKETVEGLPLAEPDYATLALELAVREVAAWRELLQAQHARMENPDRKARFAFVMPALSADVAERDRWFQSLAEVENRRREPWVLEGLSYLHHPLRASASAKYVPKSLDMLREIQQTGDIFFPKRWLDATLGGHSSKAVAAEVRGFLEKLPGDYPPRLRAITLQSADELFRAAEAR
jgi:aminopeptidase N